MANKFAPYPFYQNYAPLMAL